MLSAGRVLLETSRIINGGETSCVMATVSLYMSMFNLFTSLLSFFVWVGQETEPHQTSIKLPARGIENKARKLLIYTTAYQSRTWKKTGSHVIAINTC